MQPEQVAARLTFRMGLAPGPSLLGRACASARCSRARSGREEGTGRRDEGRAGTPASRAAAGEEAERRATWVADGCSTAEASGCNARGAAAEQDSHLAKRGTVAFFTAEDCYAETRRGGVTTWPYAIVHDRSRARAEAHEEDAGAALSFAVQPIVNISSGEEPRDRCDRTLELGDREESGLSYAGEMWRVTDIVSGDGTCAARLLALPEKPAGYWVSDFDASYGE